MYWFDNNVFIEPFLNNEFLRYALAAGILVAITCAVAGTFVVLRGLAFVGDALAHGVLPGIAVIIGSPSQLEVRLDDVLDIPQQDRVSLLAILNGAQGRIGAVSPHRVQRLA